MRKPGCKGGEKIAGLVMLLSLLSADLESMDIYVDGEKEESFVSLSFTLQ